MLELPVGMMWYPANKGSRMVCGSAKSRVQPTFGQRSVSWAGVPQNLLNAIACEKRFSLVFNPRLRRVWLTSSAIGA